MMDRKFESEGDAEAAYLLVVGQSDAISRSKQLAETYANKALTYLHKFGDSCYRRGLEVVVKSVLTRRN